MDTFTFHRAIFIFKVQVYIYNIHPTLSTLFPWTCKNICFSINTSTKTPDTSSYLLPNPLPLRLPWVVRPREITPLPFCRLFLLTSTNLFHQTHSSYFLIFSTKSMSSHSVSPSTYRNYDHCFLEPWPFTQTQCSTLSSTIPMRPYPISRLLSPLTWR